MISVVYNLVCLMAVLFSCSAQVKLMLEGNFHFRVSIFIEVAPRSNILSAFVRFLQVGVNLTCSFYTPYWVEIL